MPGLLFDKKSNVPVLAMYLNAKIVLTFYRFYYIFKWSSVFFSYVWPIVFYNDKWTGCIVKVECLNVSTYGAGASTWFFSPSNSGNNYSS